MTQPSEEEVREWLVSQSRYGKPRHRADATAALALLDAGRKDRERLDWLEQQHTLHGAVEMLYVVDGYAVNVTHDGNPTGEHWGKTLRAAIDQARGA